jgi:hypothetical protein
MKILCDKYLWELFCIACAGKTRHWSNFTQRLNRNVKIVSDVFEVYMPATSNEHAFE